MKWHIKQWPGSLHCSRLHCWIKALHALRGAVIGEEEDGVAEKWILVGPCCCAKQNPGTAETLQHLIAPSPICKTKKQKEKRRAFRLSSTQMPQGARSLCRAVFTVLSHAASAYNISKRGEAIKRQAEACGSTETDKKKKKDACMLFALCCS